uniref:NADH dehydrogenase [ubiquinone] iron-sulfur protein 5 n=1 Tax=Acanthochromis polyacanthus TaxID=80966 RepID=A0A3Q1F3K7_9TELE
MPFVDIQSRLGINVDRWLLLQSGEQPNKRAARCHAFEKEWIECSHGIGQTRAKKECQLEFEDFYECMHRQKTSDVSISELSVSSRQTDRRTSGSAAAAESFSLDSSPR